MKKRPLESRDFVCLYCDRSNCICVAKPEYRRYCTNVENVIGAREWAKEELHNFSADTYDAMTRSPVNLNKLSIYAYTMKKKIDEILNNAFGVSLSSEGSSREKERLETSNQTASGGTQNKQEVKR